MDICSINILNNKNMIINETTPIEEYNINGKTVYVKREDLSCNLPAPALAKLRGIYRRLIDVKKQGYTKAGILDTRISKSGWGCSALANEIGGIEIINYYPHLKEYGEGIPAIQQHVLDLGHRIHPLKGGRTAVLHSQALKLCEKEGAYPIPLGLVVEESVDETEKIAKNIPKKYLGGSLVVCIGSGMISAGLYKVLGDKLDFYAISAGMSLSRQRNRMEQVGIKDFNNLIHILPNVDYYYEEKTETPFPCSVYYDKKAWKWMIDNIDRLKEPIIFYNIGT